MLTINERGKTSKAMNYQADDILFDIEEETFYNFAKLCHIICHFGTQLFSKYLENNTPDIHQYKEWLGDPEVHLNLRRLRIRGLLTDIQWNMLYPQNKSSIIFPPYDLSLVLLLLKYTGLITSPIPNGWSGELVSFDHSKAAQIVRFQLIRKSVAKLTKLSSETLSEVVIMLQLIFSPFGGEEVTCQFSDIITRDMTELEALESVEFFKRWHKQEEKIFEIERKIENARENRMMEIPILQKPIIIRDSSTIFRQRKVSATKLTYSNTRENSKNWQRWTDIKTGIQEEEKDILRQFYSRLISEVRPDSMIEQLLSKKVLNVEESGEVFSSLKSAEQMDLLLDILVTKSGQAFTEFLNALKIKYSELYTDLYEEYQKMKQDLLANKPEGVSYCNSYLTMQYKKRYNSWNPILWYPEAEVSLERFYCPLKILDSKGLQVDPLKVLSQSLETVLPRVVVIEGENGTGKSYLSHYIASKWSNNHEIFETQNSIKLLFHLDLKLGSHNLKSMLIDQLFNDDMKLSERELWEVIERNQLICLFLLDGYNDNINEEVLELIKGVIFPKSYIIVFSNSFSTFILNGYYDEKFVLTGFVPGGAETFTRNYVKLCRRPLENFENLLTKLSKNNAKNKNILPSVPEIKDLDKMSPGIIRNEFPPVSARRSLVSSPLLEGTSLESVTNSNQRAGSIVPGLLMGFSKPDLTRLRKIKPVLESHIEENNESEEIATSGEDLSSYQDRQIALKFYSQFPLYCGFFCIMTDVKLGIDLTSWSALMEHFFTAIKVKLIEREREGRSVINRLFNILMEVSFECMKQDLVTTFIKENDRINKFGVLRKVLSSNSSFSSKYIFENDIVVNFLAGKCLDSLGVEETNNYFQNMTLSKQKHSLIVFYCGLRKNERETNGMKTLFRKIVDANSQFISSNENISNENIMKYQLSLECIAAMDGRNDLLQKVGEILPKKLQIEHSCIIPVLTLQGLSYILSFNCNNIKEIDIRLNYLSRQTPDALQNLANSIHQNTSLKILRIYWEQLKLMSLFFSTICEKNKTISVIECYDESNHTYDSFGSMVSNNIRSGCRNMVNIKSFTFIGCTFSTLTHTVIRNLCENLEQLDLSGCSFTIMSCSDLGDKIIQSKCLKVLKLSNVHMQGMAFNTFIRSFIINHTVCELNLNGMKMDNVCFFSLAESLKLNNRLEKLYLLNVIINERSCGELATVLMINNTLKELHITDEKVSLSGKKKIIKNLKNTKLIATVNEKVKSSEVDKDADLFTL